jgi:hypothetical protein
MTLTEFVKELVKLFERELAEKDYMVAKLKQMYEDLIVAEYSGSTSKATTMIVSIPIHTTKDGVHYVNSNDILTSDYGKRIITRAAAVVDWDKELKEKP